MADKLAKPTAAANVLIEDFVADKKLEAWEERVFRQALRGLGDRLPVEKLNALLQSTLHGRI